MKKGFTLIELLAVLVMIGLLIAVVVPNVSNLMKSQNEKKYEMYYTLVGHAVEQYAETRRDDIGGVEDEGCVNDFTIKDLITEEYLKYVDSESGAKCANSAVFNGGNAVRNCIVCGSPSDFNLSFLRGAGYNDAGFEMKTRIDNKEGIISKEVPMVCIKNNKVVYEKKYRIKPCNKYIAENVETISLLKQLSENVPSTLHENNNFFVNGSATNNYIWYSGKLWRAVSYNTNTGVIKMVTEEPIVSLTYDINDTSAREFKDTNIGIWLNSTFYASLRTPNRFLEDHNWNFTTVANASAPPTTNTNNLKVGMLNYFEYGRVGGFLNTNQSWWLLSKSATGQSWSILDTNVPRSENVKTFYGVRPSIVLKPSMTFNKGGTGTVNNPYILKGEGRIVSGVNLKDRYPGEYVRLQKGAESHLFRIVSIKENFIRLILDTPLNITNLQFHYDDKVYSSSNYIGSFLNTWKTGLNLVEGDFCRMTINANTSTNAVCQRADLINIDIAIPKVGEMFSNSSNREYWTINNYNPTNINVIKPDGTIGNKGILDSSGVRPVINLSSNVRVSGAGTKEQPFTLTQ